MALGSDEMQSYSFLVAQIIRASRERGGSKGKGKSFIYLLLYIGLQSFCLGGGLEARPVSYPGGSTLMLRNNGDRNSLHFHYSPSKNYSVGYRAEYWRFLEFQMHSVQLNSLVQRWNQLESQANFYLKSGLGRAYSETRLSREKEAEVERREGRGTKIPSETAFFAAMASDWESQRYYVAYENRYVNAGEIADFSIQSLRLGFAPYVGDYGDLHTWLMLEFRHNTEGKRPLVLTPFLRFFKSIHLFELGVEDTTRLLFNWIIRL